jgi:hypothetical protein
MCTTGSERPRSLFSADDSPFSQEVADGKIKSPIGLRFEHSVDAHVNGMQKCYISQEHFNRSIGNDLRFAYASLRTAKTTLIYFKTKIYYYFFGRYFCIRRMATYSYIY